MKKLTALLLTAALLVCLFAGCAAKQPTPAPPPQQTPKRKPLLPKAHRLRKRPPLKEKAPADMHVVLLVKQMGNDFLGRNGRQRKS